MVEKMVDLREHVRCTGRLHRVGEQRRRLEVGRAWQFGRSANRTGRLLRKRQWFDAKRSHRIRRRNVCVCEVYFSLTTDVEAVDFGWTLAGTAGGVTERDISGGMLLGVDFCDVLVGRSSISPSL